jgi:uncharacterized protein (TIGR03083 family)
MTVKEANLYLPHAAEVPYVTADEAYQLMATELERFLALVETLDAEDWGKPTACSAWDVCDILAHQAGGYASGASLREMLRQGSQRPGPGELPEDAVNAFQLQEREGQSPQELIAELRQVGPIAARKWAYGFRLFKLFSIPHPDQGRLSFRHLMWVIHSRDTWMHRLDICRAADRAFHQTPEHDGRIVELVMRDTAAVLQNKTADPPLRFELSGIAGGSWRSGVGEPTAEVRMDALEFNIFASGRWMLSEARPQMEISGDVPAAEAALEKLLVLY